MKLYTLPNCPLCMVVKFYLDSQKISYQELDAREHAELLVLKGFRQVPVIQINNRFYPISSLSDLQEILKQHGMLNG